MMNNTGTGVDDKLNIPSEKSELASDYGITVSETTYYQYRTYRYTNLHDAIAEAKRDRVKFANR